MKYNYSYDSTNKFLYLALSSISENGTTFSSSSEYAASGDTTDAEFALDVAEEEFLFSTVDVAQYSLSDSSLTLTDYFSGSLPTLCTFTLSGDTAYDSASLRNNVFDLDTNDTNNTHYYVVPSFSSDGTFSGTVYKRIRNSSDEKVYSKLSSTASGTYAVSGKGTSGSTITLTFSAPSEITAYGTSFVMTQEEDCENYTMN